MIRKENELLVCLNDTPDNLARLRADAKRRFNTGEVKIIRRGVLLQLRAAKEFNDHR